MQTTLLGLAIAIIVALVSALVAPLVVDWNHYRSAFEAEASRVTGLSVRVNGQIDARLLPSPVFTLRRIAVGQAGQEPVLSADTLELELSLSALLRGQVQASEAHLIRPQLALDLDKSGAIDWPIPAASFRPQALSISRFNVEDGRVTLNDATSGTQLLLQKVWFNGDIRSFAGPFSGEGAVVAGDELYGYRISGSRADAGAMKIRLGIDPSNHPLTTVFDGTLTFDRSVPQFDGTLALSRPVAVTLADGRRVLSDPWRLAGTVKATPASASLQQLTFQYGPDERAINMTGSADVTFGAHPYLHGSVASLQLDLDRALANPDLTNRPPLVAVRSFLQTVAASATLPMQAQVAVAIDGLSIGGTSIDTLHGDVTYGQGGWGLNNFQFHAPGVTDVTISGLLTSPPSGFAFNGPATLRSADLDMLTAWLSGRGNDRSPGEARSLSTTGDVTIASDRIAIEHLAAKIQQQTLEGRLAYNWPAGNRPARLDAELRARQLGLDGLAMLATSALGGDGFALPQEGKLALDIDTVSFAGVDARAVKAQIKFDAGKLQIDKLSVGDLGGATLAIGGRIDELSSQPRGQLTLDLDARALQGLSDIVAKLMPGAGDALHRIADRIAPAKVHGVLTVERAATGGSTADLHVNGTLAAMRLALDGKGSGEPSHLADANVRLDGRIDSDDGSALVALLGLDRLVAIDQLPGRLTLSASGPLNGDLHLDGNVGGSGIDASLQGTLRLGGDAPRATLQLKAKVADLRPLQQRTTGQPGNAVPASAQAALAIDGSVLSFTDIAVTAGKTSARGRITANLASPLGIDGDMQTDAIDATATLGMLLGLPSSGDTSPWSSSPVGAGVFAAMNGAVTFKIGRADFTPTLMARDLKGVIHFRPAEISLDDLDGGLAGGHLGGALSFRNDQDGLAAHVRIELAGASAATVLGPSMNAVDGSLTMALQCDGVGRSPLGLIGSLHGNGSVTLKDTQFAGLDVTAFDAAIQATDQDGKIDVAKIQAAINAALANGRAAVPQGSVAANVTSGVINLTHAVLKAQRDAELALDGAIDLGRLAIDARMSLSEPPPVNALIPSRPELSVALKGPLGAPQRTLDTAALMNWLTLRAAELQTRRLESIEANHRDGPGGPAGHPDSPDVRVVPPGAVSESEIPSRLRVPPGRGGHGGPERLQPQGAPPVVPDPNRSGSIGGHGAASVVPPPLVIRPPEPQSQSPATPPPERSGLNLLFSPPN